MQVSIRNLTAWLLAKSFIISGLAHSAKKKILNGEYILSIYFHNPSKEEFESCVKWLKENNFLFLSTSDLECIMQGKLPFPKGGVLLTVDDGWESNEKNVVAIANKYEVPVTIFIATAPVEEGTFWWSFFLNGKQYLRSVSLAAMKKASNQERLLQLEKIKKEKPIKREALTIEQIKKIASSKYISIGGHTHTHSILTNCYEDEVRTEIQLSKQKLESWIGKEVGYFAYPNGDYGVREIQILKESNYRLAFSIQEQYLTPDALKEPYSIPRFCFVEGASFSENICRLLGIWKFSRLRLKQSISEQMRKYKPILP